MLHTIWGPGMELREEELLRHGVTCMRVKQHCADEVNGMLDMGGSVHQVLFLLR